MDNRIIIAKGKQFQSQMFHIWAKAHKSRQVLMVARGLADPSFHAYPFIQGQSFGVEVSANDNQVTVHWPCPQAKQTSLCGRAQLCSCPSLGRLRFLEFSQGPWKPPLALHLSVDSGVHCSPGRATGQG